MSDLACQFMDVMSIPKELDAILRQKSHGVASWCEQLIKDMIISNHIMVVSTDEAFKKTEDESIPSGTRTLPNNEEDDLPQRPATPTYTEIAGKDLRSTVLRRMSLPSQQGKKPVPLLRERSSSVASTKSSHINAGVITEIDEYPEDLWTPTSGRKSSASSSSDPYSRRGSLFTDELEEIKEIPVAVSYNFDREDFVSSSESCMPHDTRKVCIIAPGVDLSKVLVPDSVKDMVLARVDRMLPGEQLILKCASILGLSFPRNVLEAILPQSMASNVDIVLYNLAKEGILECSCLALMHQHAHNHHGFYDYNEPSPAHQHTHHHHHHHHHNVTMSLHAPVLCGCHADEGTKVITLRISCLTF